MSRSTDGLSVSVSAANEPRVSTHAPFNLRRREFLLGLGVSSVGAATLALNNVTSDLVPGTAQSPANPSGYRDTAHIQNYYRTAKV